MLVRLHGHPRMYSISGILSIAGLTYVDGVTWTSKDVLGIWDT